jgi:hypothetical protein
VITVTLRHLWTSTGEPLKWDVTGDDERVLRDLLQLLDEWKADPDKRSAVLLAHDDVGALIGVWNRAGAQQLWHMIDTLPHSEALMPIRRALMDGVTGP